MDGKLMTFAAALCAAFPSAAPGAEEGAVPETSPEGGYAVIRTWADVSEYAGEIDIEEVSIGGYSVIRGPWSPAKESADPEYPLQGVFGPLVARRGGGTATAYNGEDCGEQGHLVVYWGNMVADDAMLCAGFGSYRTHPLSNSQCHVPIGPTNCPQ